MKFEARQDIDAPIDFVFGRVTDFANYERQALRRGADVRRTDAMTRKGPGMAWDAVFEFRGKERRVSARIVAFDEPNGYRVASESAGIDGDLVIDLVALSRTRTRLTVSLELSAKSLGAKLMLQSFKVAKGSLNKRFEARIAAMAQDIAERHAKRPG